MQNIHKEISKKFSKKFVINHVDQLQNISNLLIKKMTAILEKNHQNKMPNNATVIFLQGTLGVGKTAFVKNLLKTLGYQGVVKSPSYAILNSYEIESFLAAANSNQEIKTILQHIQHIHHFDAYRIQSLQQWFDYQFEDCFAHNQICLIEWPENCQAAINQVDFILDFKFENISTSLELNLEASKAQTSVRTIELKY